MEPFIMFPPTHQKQLKKRDKMMAKISKGFSLVATADENGTFTQATATLIVGSTDDTSFQKVRTKVLSPSPENIVLLQAILNDKFNELINEEGIT